MRNPRARVDSNQPEIVAALRAAGASVQHLHMVGQGCPDICAGYQGKNYLFEIKMPGESLTTAELLWFSTWQGEAHVVYSAEQAIEIITGGNRD
jgi:hypothetical protein